MTDHNMPPDKVLELALMVRGAIGLVTEEVAATTLGLRSVSTLATWRSQGTGPAHVKLGKGVFYTVNALAAWVNEEQARQREERKAA